MPAMQYVRRGQGRPLLLIHGLGGTWRSWNPILDQLALARDVIAIDLPGFGATPPLSEVCFRTLSDAVCDFISDLGLSDVDIVGISMGGRLALELAHRKAKVGTVIALAPGGFRTGRHRHSFFLTTLGAIRLIRRLQPVMPRLTRSPVGRRWLLSAFCHQPTKVSPQTALDEMRGFAAARSFERMLYQMTYRTPLPQLPQYVVCRRIVIGWGKNDRICLPSQAPRAVNAFPNAQLVWFERAGHYPHWDLPEEITQFILSNTDSEE